LPEELTSNVITELRSQYAAAKQQADRLSVRLGPRHPERLAIEAQLAGVREQIAGEMRRVVASIQTELKRAVQLEQGLSSRLAQLKVRQGSVSEDLVSLREFERDAAAKRAVYEGFLLRAKETGEQRDINTANMSVISSAFAPLNPLGPSRSMIALTGALLGFFAGVGVGGARGAWQSLRENAAARPREAGGSSSPFDTPPPSPLGPRDPSRRPVATSPAADDHPMRGHPGVTGSPLPAFAVQKGWMPGSHGSQQPLPHVRGRTTAYPYGVYPPQPPMPTYPSWPAGGVPPSDPPAPLRRHATNDSPPKASIDEVRHSLRDFHEAVREFAERRGRRRSI
jgi:hypothetical protein